MSNNAEQLERSISREQERSPETKEGKEKEMSAEDKVAAAKERADYLVKEVKSSQQQMQNILIHMAQVKNAIAQIRAQLQLTNTRTDDSSLSQDKERVEELKKRIATYQEEIIKMRDDLIRFQEEELSKQPASTLSLSEIRAKATEMVDRLIAEITH